MASHRARSAPPPRAASIPDARLAPASLPAGVAIEVFAHARECYPEECCGLLLRAPGEEPARVVRCTNVQNLRRSSGESELDAGHGFWIDETELLRALREADARGEQLCAIYHSHVDTAAYLSRADLQGALGPDGRPLWRDVAQLVVAVWDGMVEEAALFEWNEGKQSFEGRPLRGTP